MSTGEDRIAEALRETRDLNDESFGHTDSHKVDKVTARDIQRRMEKTKAEKRRRRQAEHDRRAPFVSLVRIIISVVLVLATLGMLFYMTSTASRYENKISENNRELADLHRQIDEAKNAPVTSEDTDSFSSVIVRANDTAQEVTDVQNKLREISPEIMGNEEKSAEYADIAKDSRRFFNDKTISSGEFMPAMLWYAPMEMTVGKLDETVNTHVPPEEWVWDYTTSDIPDARGNVQVMWTAHFTGDKHDNEMLAWVIGTYNSGSGLLSNMKRGLTAEGIDHIGATPDNKDAEANMSDIRQAEKDMLDKANEDKSKLKKREENNNKKKDSSSTSDDTADDDTSARTPRRREG